MNFEFRMILLGFRTLFS